MQTQLGRLAALKGFLDSQQEDLSSDDPQNADVDLYVDIVQATFQVRVAHRTPLLLRSSFLRVADLGTNAIHTHRRTRRASHVCVPISGTQRMCCDYQVAAGSRTVRTSTMYATTPVISSSLLQSPTHSNTFSRARILQTFKTPLPPELVVDFSIHRGELVRRHTVVLTALSLV